MEKFDGFDKAKQDAKVSGTGGRLPAGAYICKILKVELVAEEGKSKYLHVLFDVNEGEYKDFFTNQYKANTREDKKYKGHTKVYIPKNDGSDKDEWTKTTFAKWTNALEDSNPGYTWDWDENKWKDKVLCIVFGDTGSRIDGKDIVYTEARYPVSIDTFKAGKAGEAKFKAKGDYGKETSDDFMSVPDNLDEELPF